MRRLMPGLHVLELKPVFGLMILRELKAVRVHEVFPGFLVSRVPVERRGAREYHMNAELLVAVVVLFLHPLQSVDDIEADKRARKLAQPIKDPGRIGPKLVHADEGGRGFLETPQIYTGITQSK